METSANTFQMSRVDRLRAQRRQSQQTLSHFDFTALNGGDTAEIANREESFAVDAILASRTTQRSQEAADALRSTDVDHCRDCGERIGAARKAALAHVQRCVQCQRIHEKTN